MTLMTTEDDTMETAEDAMMRELQVCVIFASYYSTPTF